MNAKALLTFVCGFAAPKSPVANLSAVRISETHLYATDTVSSMRVKWDGPAGMDVAVPAQRLATALAGLPDDQHIKLQKADGMFITLVAGRRRLKLNTVIVDGMPEINVRNRDALKFRPVAGIDDALRFAMIGAEKKSTVRPQFNGVLIEQTAAGTFAVGSDGYRMMVAKANAEGGKAKSLLPLTMAGRLAALMKLGGEVAFDLERVVWRTEDKEFIGTLASHAGFPAWEGLIARIDDAKLLKITGSQASIHEAVKDAERLDFRPVVMEAKKGVLSITGGTMAGDEFEHSVEIDQPENGRTVTSSFNPRYVSDALGAFAEYPSIGMPDVSSGHAMVMRQGENLAFIQPMRV